MSLWHADANQQSLATGASVLVVSGDKSVRVVTADQLWIETPNGQRLSTVVLDRTGENLTLSMPDGASVFMSMSSDHSLERAQEGLEFSRQVWVVN